MRCAADGLKDAIWLVWRTLIQYGDDYGVRKLAAQFHPRGEPVYLDHAAWDDMNFMDRKQISIELALGMMSEENQMGRIQIIQQCQTQLYAAVQGMAAQGTLTPEVFAKVKKPYEDMLYVLGVKDVDTYLPSDDEVKEMIAQAQQAAETREPSPEDQKDLAQAELNRIKAQEIQFNMTGQSPNDQLEYMSMALGQPKVYNG